MNCNYCQDTKFTDKNGTPKGEHVGRLIPCPLCNKDKPEKLEIDLEWELKQASRKNAAWTARFNAKWSEEAVKGLAIRIDQMIVSTKNRIAARIGKPTKDKEQRLEFDCSFPYEYIVRAFEYLGIPKTDYAIELDRMGENDAY